MFVCQTFPVNCEYLWLGVQLATVQVSLSVCPSFKLPNAAVCNALGKQWIRDSYRSFQTCMLKNRDIARVEDLSSLISKHIQTRYNFMAATYCYGLCTLRVYVFGFDFPVHDAKRRWVHAMLMWADGGAQAQILHFARTVNVVILCYVYSRNCLKETFAGNPTRYSRVGMRYARIERLDPENESVQCRWN